MAASSILPSSRIALHSSSGRIKAAVLMLLFALPVLGTQLSAQSPTTTTISGTVYDPRTTASALPLPNVLVYVTTGSVDPLPSGVQCLTTSAPTGVLSYVNTAVDGTFTLGDVPINGTYTVVIQAGKWRRQFTETVAGDPLTGLTLHMPADHTQGDIPKIGIATGSVDALECVLRDMGIADTEFTDDNGTTNPGGRIHLYRGITSAGADINASTPSETVLMGTPTDSSVLSSYDMVMFPCQGSAHAQTTTALTNLFNYANTGGRVFTTHFSYDRLDPATPYDALFPPVANWHLAQSNPSPDPGIATVNTGFTDGATLAQWLQNAGASYNNKAGQIQISTLRHDFDGVIAPTQAWLNLNNTTSGNPVMQFTFNTPVGAAAANQCGRVLFNEYHVFNASSGSAKFPAECPTPATHVMSAQEAMLEYALFDLSTFVTPVVVPTLSISFSPSPLIVKQGDTADQVTATVTNTSSTAVIYSTAVLSFTVPAGLTVTAMTDSTGGWICDVGTLTCTRTTSIASSASDPLTLTVSVPAYGSGSSATGQIVATVTSPNFSNNVVASDNVIFQQPPAITWATPAPIAFGTALSGTQLNASSPIAGSFSYTPAAGTVLSIGAHTLTATFTPTDTVDYTTSTASVSITVIPATPSITLISSVNAVFLSNPVTFTATVTASATAPTGTVVFYDGATQIGSGTIASGVAAITTSALVVGVHSITATYSGDINYLGISATVGETVEDFTITPAGGSGATATGSGSPGTTVSYPLVVTPVGGSTLPSAITFTITGLPLGATAVFNPTTLAANAGTSNVTLQVKLAGQAAMHPPQMPFGKGSLPIALGILLLPFARRLRKTARLMNRLIVLALLAVALASGLSGCGGGAKLTPESYSLTLTATSGNLSHTLSANVTVK